MAPPSLTLGRTLVPSHSVVDDEAERARFWKRLEAAWGKQRSGFPGANPVSLARATLASLRAAPHVVALKSDGVRYALFLTTRADGSPVALMVDRARHMHEVEVLASADYFYAETLLEGELVWRQPDGATLLFLVFDAVQIKGTSLLHYPFVERLEAARKCTAFSEEIAQSADAEARVAETDSIALVHYAPPILMRPKTFVDAAHAARVWSERADAAHRVDGLVLHRADAPYVHGTATGAVYKWKPEHTVDLAGPAHALRGADGPLGERVGARKVVVQPSRIVVERDEDVAEYLIDVQEEDVVRLFAMRTRPDKRAPNGLRVIAATVRDAEEAITPDEL